MKSFHKTMGYLSGIFLLMIIISVSIASSYMTRNDLTLDDLFSDSSTLQYGDNGNVSFFGIWGSENKASSFETLTLEQSDVFDLKKEIFVSASIEEVKFIEEDRNDILVEFFREQPDTSNYDVKYKTSTTSDKLTISASMFTKNIAINKKYQGTISIHVPKDYYFDKVTIDSGAAKVRTENIYTKTNSLSTIASFGDIDLNIDSPINNVTISCNFGSIDLEVNALIDDLDISCDMGEIQLSLNDNIKNLTVNENLGDIDIQAAGEIETVFVKNNMGSIHANFEDHIGKASFENNMGDINVGFKKNDDISIYIDTDLGSISTDFSTTSSKSSDFSFSNNMGSIKVVKN